MDGELVGNSWLTGRIRPSSREWSQGFCNPPDPGNITWALELFDGSYARVREFDETFDSR